METKRTISLNWRAYSVFTSLLLVIIFLTAFTTSRLHQHMDELTVKRINIIEEDGTVRMVLSNKSLQHPGRIDGEDFAPRDRHAGILFFNDEGDECGGLIYGVTNKNGKKDSGMSLTMDQYKNDQVMQILNHEVIEGDKIRSSRGFMINDYPKGSHYSKTKKAMEEASTITDATQKRTRMMEIQKESGPRPLVFLGKSRDGSNGLFLNDAEGNPKLMIYVDAEGNPKIQTMDAKKGPQDLIIK
jgi:hypothetical protein